MQNLRVLIFDEADQLLDMGFRPAIQEMLSRLPPKETRQTLLFSATMPSDVAAIAKLGMSACGRRGRIRRHTATYVYSYRTTLCVSYIL